MALNPPIASGTSESGIPREDFFSALGAAHVRYCLLRGSTERVVHEGDWDLLVDPAHWEQVQRLFALLDFVPRPGARIPHKLVYERYHGACLEVVDLHERISQYGLVYMDEKVALKRRTFEGGIPRLSPEDAAIHLVVHALLRSGDIKEEARDRLADLMASGLDRSAMIMQLRRFGLEESHDRACRWILEGPRNPSERRRIQASMRWALLSATPSNVAGAARYHLRRFLVRRPSGGVIAIVGADGSGKTTVVRSIRERASRIPGLRVGMAYLGPWGQMATPWVTFARRMGIVPALEPWGSWLRARLAGEGHDVDDLSPARKRPLGWLARKWATSQIKGALFYSILWAELWYRYLTAVLPRTTRGVWMVSDRYITDLRYLYKGDVMRNYALLRWAACALFPRPRAYVLLEPLPELVHGRKKDLTLPQIHEFQGLYRRALEGKSCLRISEDLPAEAIADEVIGAILRGRAGRPIGAPLSSEPT